MHYNEDTLLTWNQRGLFPGPQEGSESFFKRAEASSAIHAIAHTCVLDRFKEQFNAAPDWVEVRSSAKGLLPWEGAATWIEESDAGQKTAAIQIKPSLPVILYSQEEVLMHEWVHATRLHFEENRFEEILAYRTSNNRFRRYFGPLFSRPSEAKAFIFLTLGSWLVYWTEMLFDIELYGQFLFFLPCLALAGGILRLMRSQRTFSAALKHIEKTIAKPGKSLACALRLSDAEIAQFATSSPQEILAFAEKEKEMSLRWRQLFLAYFYKGKQRKDAKPQ